MQKTSERVFEAFLIEFIVTLIAIAADNKVTQVILIGLGTLVAATIAFVPKLTLNLRLRSASKQTAPISALPFTLLSYSSLAFYVQWIFTNATATAAAWVLAAISQTWTWNWEVVFVPHLVEGSVVGLLQWLVLRKQLPNARFWILATIFGLYLARRGQAMTTALISDPPIVFYALGGLIVGLLQWLKLKGDFERSSWWIAANTVSWAAAGLVSDFAFSQISSDRYVSFAEMTVEGAIFGTISSIITGIALIQILHAKDSIEQ